MQRTRRVIGGTLTGLLQFGVAIGLQIVLMPLVLHAAGQSVLGVYAILQQVIGYLALVELGLSSALGRYLSQASDQSERFRPLLDVGFRLMLLIGTAYTIIGTALAAFFPDMFHLTGSLRNEAQSAMLLLALWGFMRFATAIYGLGLMALQDLTWPPLFGALGNIGRVVYSIVALRMGFGLTGLCLGLIVAEVISTLLILLRYCQLRPSWTVRWRNPEQHLTKELFSFGLKAFWAGLAGRVISFTDNIVVGYLYGPAVTSVYYNTQTPVTLAYYQVFLLANNAAPEINRLWGAGEWAKLRDILLRLQRLTLLLSIPIVAGGWFYLPSVISIWVGPGQFGGQWLTLWLVLFAGITPLRYVGQVAIFASGNILRYSQFVTVEAAINLTLSFILGAKLGPHGVALATLVAQIPTAVYSLSRVHRDLHIDWRTWLAQVIGPAFVASVPMALASALLSAFVPPTRWLALGAQVGAVGLLHIVSAYFLGLSSPDRQAVQSLTRRLWASLPLRSIG